jgi:hypothetical protein
MAQLVQHVPLTFVPQPDEHQSLLTTEQTEREDANPQTSTLAAKFLAEKQTELRVKFGALSEEAAIREVGTYMESAVLFPKTVNLCYCADALKILAAIGKGPRLAILQSRFLTLANESVLAVAAEVVFSKEICPLLKQDIFEANEKAGAGLKAMDSLGSEKHAGSGSVEDFKNSEFALELLLTITKLRRWFVERWAQAQEREAQEKAKSAESPAPAAEKRTPQFVRFLRSAAQAIRNPVVTAGKLKTVFSQRQQ